MKIRFIVAVMAAGLAVEAAGAHQLSETELENLVAPVALYPDVLLDFVLDASEHPSALVSAGDFLHKHDSGAKPDDSWPASVLALLPYPHVISKLDDQLSWTTRLGNAHKKQKKELEKAIQVVRAKAQAAGNLTSNQHENVETVNNVINIVPTNPEVVYVPVYNPSLVYYPAAPYAAPLVTFGAGVAVGAAFEHNYDYNHYDWYHHHYYDHINAAHFNTGVWHGGHVGVNDPWGRAGVTHVGGPQGGVTHVGGWGAYGHGGATVGHYGNHWGGFGHYHGTSGFHAGGFHGGGFGGFHGGGFHMHGGFRR